MLLICNVPHAESFRFIIDTNAESERATTDDNCSSDCFLNRLRSTQHRAARCGSRNFFKLIQRLLFSCAYFCVGWWYCVTERKIYLLVTKCVLLLALLISSAWSFMLTGHHFCNNRISGWGILHNYLTIMVFAKLRCIALKITVAQNLLWWGIFCKQQVNWSATSSLPYSLCTQG